MQACHVAHISKTTIHKKILRDENHVYMEQYCSNQMQDYAKPKHWFPCPVKKARS